MVVIEALLRKILQEAYSERITDETIQLLWRRIEAEMDRWKNDGPAST